MSAEHLTKRCGTCKVAKPLDSFSIRRASADGLMPICRDCGRIKQHAWYLANKAKVVAYATDWNHRNPKKARESIKKCQLAKPEKYRAAQRAWRRDHPEKSRRYSLKWQRAHPEKCRQNNAKQRAIRRACAVGDSKAVKAFYRTVHAADRMKCYWCGSMVAKRDRHVDHIVPIARGGTHTALNLCCSCARCNCRKHSKLPSEFTGQHELFT